MGQAILLRGGGGGISSDEVTATRADVLAGKTTITSDSNDEIVSGTIPTKTASDLSASGATVTVPAGYYASQVSKAVASGSATGAGSGAQSTPSISIDSAGKITASVAATSVSVTPTVSAGYVSAGTAGTVTMSASSNALQMTTKGATTFNTSTSDQTIASGTYLTGTQTFRKVTTSNISAGNIKHGVVVKVGDAADDDRIATATGSFYNDGTTYTLSSTGTSIDMGASSSNRYITTSGLYKPSATKGATTFNTSTSDQSIASGTYLTGAQTIKAVKTSNISAGNIKHGVLILVGDANSTGRIANVTGSHWNDGTTYTLSSTGTIDMGASTSHRYITTSGLVKPSATKAATTYTPTTSNQTIAAGTYCSGAQTIAGDGDLVAGNIKKGVNIFNVAGTYYGSKQIITSATHSTSTTTDSDGSVTFKVPASGTVYYSGMALSPSGAIYCQIKKNGSVIASCDLSRTEYYKSLKNQSFSVAANDTIEVYTYPQVWSGEQAAIMTATIVY